MGRNKLNFRRCRTPMVFKIKTFFQRLYRSREDFCIFTSRGTSSESNRRLNIRAVTWNGASGQTQVAIFSAPSFECRGRLLSALDRAELKFWKSLGIMLIRGTSMLLPTLLTSVHFSIHINLQITSQFNTRKHWHVIGTKTRQKCKFY
jgi:hypothetical protein